MPMDGELDGDDMPGTPPAVSPVSDMPEKKAMPTISPEMLPEGAKAGDTFVLGQPDKDGMFPITMAKGMDKGKDDGDMENWVKDFKTHMKPTMGEET